MSRTNILPIHVEFGDCDPAGIVWFPNFFRWFDAGSRRFFIACGVPIWKELEKTTGIFGTPLVDTQARFVRPASYGDEIEVHTSIVEWRAKAFVMRHRIVRAGELLCECDEVRVFAARRTGEDPRAIRAVPIPEDIRALCEVP